MLNRRRQIILGLILLAATAALVYGERAIYTLKILNATRVGQQFRQTYAHATRDVVFNPGMTPRLDVYSPASGDKHPVLIFVHGGGWKDFDKTLFASVAQKMLPENLVVVIPDYTLYPHGDYRLMAREVAAVIAWTLDHIASYGGDPQRVTFDGTYNVSPHLSPDGKSLAYITRNGGFRVALMDLATRQTQILTDSAKDESPSFAPNGRMILYASEIGGRGVLAAVSTDGRIKQRLSVAAADVREPAWGPLPKK